MVPLRLRAAGAALCTLLGGCATLSIDGPGGPAGRRTYVGVVHVDGGDGQPSVAPEARVRVLDVSTLGLRIDGGVSLGYLKDRLFSIPPDCRIVIFVRDLPELQAAQSLVHPLTRKGNTPCVASEP